MNRFSCAVLSILFVPVVAYSADQPNIVFILADDVGCEPLGCYGGTSYPTPRIDELSASGMRFQHCYSMPVCHPTRICILSGQYPMKVNNPKWGSYPPDLEKTTLAHRMKERGYATAVAGKWQLAMLGTDLEHPHRLGFDDYCLFGWHEGPRYHDPLIWQNGSKREDTDGKYGPDIYVDFLIDFMERERDEPFFAFYSMALCHDVTDDLMAPVPYVPGKDRYLNYAEMIADMDRCVGRIVDALDRLKLRDNTLIVFTGDNGTAKGSIIRTESSGTKTKYIRDEVWSVIDGKPVRGGKGNLTNDGTLVPLIASWTGTIKPGQVVNDLVDFSDFVPTFASVGGRELSDDVVTDGTSFAPRLRGEGSDARQWAFSQGRGLFWVRTQDWKLYNNGRFFNVAADVSESKPLKVSGLSQKGASAHRMLSSVVDQLK